MELKRFPLKPQGDCQLRLRTERERLERPQQSQSQSFQEEAQPSTW
jgi:hypothetical protein